MWRSCLDWLSGEKVSISGKNGGNTNIYSLAISKEKHHYSNKNM